MLEIKESDRELWANWKQDSITKEFLRQITEFRKMTAEKNGTRVIDNNKDMGFHNSDVGYTLCLQDIIDDINSLGQDK